MNLLLMDEATATALRDADTGPLAALEPVLVQAGPYAGQYALSPNVLNDPAFAGIDALHGLTATDVDLAAAWPE
jgi:hypothetical protein